MSKFKVGDRIRQSYGSHNAGVVIKLDVGSTRVTYLLDGASDTSWDNERDLELEFSGESELSGLVRKANEGLEAIGKLLDRQIEKGDHIVAHESGRSIFSYFGITTVKDKLKYTPPKPAPKFEPFTVGDGWNVSVVSDSGGVLLAPGNVAIGCRAYWIASLIADLQALCRGTQSAVPCSNLKATREGIREGSSNNISWADADRLLAALEKYQQELKEAA